MKEDVLPEGWELKKLGSVVQYEKGKKPSNLNDEKNDIFTIPYIDIQGFEKGIIKSWTDGKNARLCQNSDLLMVWDGARAGLVGSGSTGALGSTLMKISFPKVNHTYGFYFLYSKFSDINSNTKGTGIPHVDPSVLWNFEFPIPPLPEQQYLSQKLTALLDEVAQTKQRLEAIPAQLKQFRQSVLADAVSGRLMEIAPRMTKMSDIAKFQNGFAFNSEDFSKSGEWQVFRLGNIRDGFLFYENKPVFISEKLAKTQEKFIPKVGDSLISMTGTRFKQDYGFACIIEKDEKILVNQRVGRIIPIKDKIIPKFLNLSLRSEHFRQQFFKGETGGVNQGNVGSKHIMSISINLPTLEQQTQIVQKVETYFALADEIETQVNAALENVNLLTQSILSKAFSGELSAAWRTQQAVKN